MLFVLDIGNTNIVLGLFENDKIIHRWRISTELNKTEDEYFILVAGLLETHNIDQNKIENIIISNVVPPIAPVFQTLARRIIKKDAIFIDTAESYGMPVLIDQPKELGADRIVNAIAGYEKYQQALIIVDFGTATTLDIVSQAGEYLGGVIVPGVKLSLEALSVNTSRLPHVELEIPATVIGKNTIESMQSGILYGYAGLIDSLVEKIKMETNENYKVIATGGLAVLLKNITSSIESVQDDLTLWGLFIIYTKKIKLQKEI